MRQAEGEDTAEDRLGEKAKGRCSKILSLPKRMNVLCLREWLDERSFPADEDDVTQDWLDLVLALVLLVTKKTPLVNNRYENVLKEQFQRRTAFLASVTGFVRLRHPRENCPLKLKYGERELLRLYYLTCEDGYQTLHSGFLKKTSFLPKLREGEWTLSDEFSFAAVTSTSNEALSLGESIPP